MWNKLLENEGFEVMIQMSAISSSKNGYKYNQGKL